MPPPDWPCLCSRPRPPPAQPMSSLLRPAIHMTWRDLSFMHWRVDPDALRPLIPEPWRSICSGEAGGGGAVRDERGTRLGAPHRPWPGTPELNLRTYVRHGDRQGVWFFSLDACSGCGAGGAPDLQLPYLDARMSIERGRRRGGRVDPVLEPAPGRVRRPARRLPRAISPVRSRGRGRGVPRALPDGALLPLRPAGLRRPRSLAGLVRGDIEHDPWPLQPAEVELEELDMFRIIGLLPEGPP